MDTAALGKQIAAESRGRPDADPRDVLSKFDREIVGKNCVMVRFPLLDVMQVIRHLEIVEQECRSLREKMQRSLPDPDRSLLFMARGKLRALHQMLNAYRKPKDW